MNSEDNNLPGFTASPELQAKIDALDDNLAPVGKDLVDDGKKTEEPTEEKDESIDEVEKNKDTDESKETDDDSKESSNEEDGYAIDDGDEEEEPEPTNSTLATPTERTAESQYVYDNLTKFKVRGTYKDEVVEYELISAEQLPAGFQYEDQQQNDKAILATARNETKAEQLTQDYRNQETSKASAEFKTREDNADRQDIGSLQRNGDIPLFKHQPNSKEFDTDPSVVLVNDIMKFKEDTNQRYLDEYNAGRTYKHIGFEEAFRMYKYQNPNKVDTALEKEDTARKDLAGRTNKTRGTNSEPVAQKRPPAHRTSRDLENLIESLDW